LASSPPPDHGDRPLARLLGDGALRAAHEHMLKDVQPRVKGEIDVHLAVALMRIDDAADRNQAIAMLSPREAFAVMADRDALRRLAAKPETAALGATRTR
jgi:hypothetical protein